MKILDGIVICNFIACLVLAIAINDIKADDNPLPCSNKKVLKVKLTGSLSLLIFLI